jgi:TonB family protein
MFYRTTLLSAIFIISLLSLKGQEYQAPQTRMPNNLIKDFIHTHIEYPESALNNKEEGTVLISFTVNKEGRVTDKEFVKSVSESIDSAALKLFNMILWEPAKYIGKPVDGTNEFKIKYSIKRYSSIVKKRGYDKIPLPFEPVSSSLTIYTVKELDKAPEALLDSTYKSAQEFITQNLVLPEAALKLNLIGYVKLRFVIEPNGLPSNLMVIEPLGGGCTEEAIRIVQLLKWFPGIKYQEAVRTCYNLSFKFDPADEIKSKVIPNQSNTGI